MLSVGDNRSRARSKSRERSRTREVRAPSPASRAPAPSSRRSKQAYDSDSEAVSDEDSDDGRYERRRGDDRYDDRRRVAYEDDRNRDRDRRRRDQDEDDRNSRYAKPSKYAATEQGRHDSYSREKDKGYELPGTFKEYEDREPKSRGGDRYSISSPTEPPAKSSRGGLYERPSKYQYEQAPSEIKYVSKDAARTSDRGVSYVSKASTEIEIERRRHPRDKPESEEDDEDAELERQYAEIQRLKKQKEEGGLAKRPERGIDIEKKRKEIEEAEFIRKYEREIELEKKKQELERKQIKYKDEDSDEEIYQKYLREKHSNEDRDHDRRKSEVTIAKKYKDSGPEEIRPSNSRHTSLQDMHTMEIRPSNSRHTSLPDSHAVEIRPRENSTTITTLKPVESGLRRLSISGGGAGLSLMAPGAHHGPVGGGKPPGSPLLEAYHGTYQSISPMPSPMALPSTMDDGLSDLDQLDDPHIIRPKKVGLKKRVEIYDPETDAKILGTELNGRKPSAAALIKVLPSLSDDNMIALRTEYKKQWKTQGKGINVAKHIKVKFTGNIGKIAYATSLGRWESEAHWANFWYQAGSSRRELLIESLLGRSNMEIRKIKDAFSDKRYNDSLEKCMQTELKKDKFRHAILLALEERRMDEISPVLKSQVRADVDTLYKALTAREGGETAMIDVIVVRSDNHLREVLRDFESRYKANFARQMIAKSQNLVGESLAHILNGVLNKPVRDALLLHQALAETAKDRGELLMSRLIRYHWDPKHLEKIKAEYRTRYKTSLEHDIRQGYTKGDFSDFCIALCDGATR